MARLLIVDDEKNILRSLETFFLSCGHSVTAASEPRAALDALAAADGFDLVLTDFRMAEMNGLELLEQIKRRFPDASVVLMTAYATVENAVAAMKAGASDYLSKPFSLKEVQHVVDRALELRSLRVENRTLRAALEDLPLLESRSPRMRALVDTSRQAAASDATILLLGESGTGKNVLAREIHGWSPRSKRPFVAVNCTTLSEHLLESELFGHVRGSFTGAVKDKPGRLEAADRGTVFLDEIADLPVALQAKLLRFLQERRFERVGGSATIEVDARIIAATNRNLEQEVAAGRLREDLYYRVNVIMLAVPALRERPEDIMALAARFLAASALRNRRPGLKFAPEAAQALCRYRWPGNVRELRNAIERAAVLSRGEIIRQEDLPDSIFRPPQSPSRAAPESSASLEEVERDHIRRVLADAVTLEEAADTLGISVATLWRKRKRYGIE
jgi:two-component system, NtrC family, response regulator AlgB